MDFVRGDELINLWGDVRTTFVWLVNVVCTFEDFKCVRKVDVRRFRQG